MIFGSQGKGQPKSEADMIGILTSSYFFIAIGAAAGAISLVSASYGFTLLAQEMADKKALVDEKSFSIADATIDINFIFDRDEFRQKNPAGLSVGKFNVIFNIRSSDSDEIKGRFTISGSWQKDLPGFYDLGDEMVYFSSSEAMLSMVRMHPQIEFISPSIRQLKPGHKYHFDFVGFPNPSSFQIRPTRLVIRTKHGETHLAENFDGPHQSNWFSFVFITP